MSVNGLKVHPMARLFAIVPVVLIAVGVIAFVQGFRLEGRQPVSLAWRTLSVAEHNFAVAAPGMFIVNRQPMNIGDENVEAHVYAMKDSGVTFSVSATRRPNTDQRPLDEVAERLGMSGTAAASPTSMPMFRYDDTRQGERTQALLIFNDRMMYQLMVTAPAASYPSANAARFLGSFRLLTNN